MERISTRIVEIVRDELPKHSFGLNIIGIDVLFGPWNITTPQGPVQIQSFAILIAVRSTTPSGAAILGNVPPIVHAHVLQSPYPSEAEIRAGVNTSCETIRKTIKNQQVQGNGQGPIGPDSMNTIVKGALRKQLPEGK